MIVKQQDPEEEHGGKRKRILSRRIPSSLHTIEKGDGQRARTGTSRPPPMDVAGTSVGARPGLVADRNSYVGYRARLVFASFLLLFVELALIRWTAANNVYLSSATNFVLLASFLGIGLGFMSASSQREFLRWTPLAFLTLVGFVLAFPVILRSPNSAHPYGGLQHSAALPLPVSLGVLFVFTVAVMAGLGQAVSRIFVELDPLSAYRLDIVGSIAGIAVFSALSFLALPPLAWGVIGAGGLAALLGRTARWWQWAAIGGVALLLAIDSFAPHEQWSAYYKLSVDRRGNATPAVYVTANNVPYQAARSLAVLHAQKTFYFYPYRHVTRAALHNVLVIGAGTGNDVSVALSEGAKHIDAVEIDPSLLRIGRDLNPDHPYQNPRVTTYVADGREYLQDTSQRYNLILFGMPDSLTVLAGQSNLRLEDYLLTIQSIRQVRARLAPGGIFSMYNYYQPYLLARYATTIERAFHHEPCVDVGPSLGRRRLAVLTIRLRRTVPECASLWHGRTVPVATDDHPFPYLRNWTIPVGYLRMLAAILAGAVLLVLVGARGTGSFTGMRRYLDLAFMGAAFLLLETKNIVQFALLFGSTWFVNSLVFAAVLLTVYLAVETASRLRLPRPIVLYGALVASLVVAWLIPQESLLGLPLALRFLAGGALAFAPVFAANLVFAQRFSGVRNSGAAFAANLLGAMVGGALEYLALITGYQFLLVLAGALYSLAFVIGRIGVSRP
jgi:hypothetical protein